jgi:hypothetical protein
LPQFLIYLSQKVKTKITLFALITSFFSWSQVSMTTTGSYSQDFNSLANTGTANAWVDNSTIPNWYSQRTGTGTTYEVSTGSNNTGNLYSFGTSAATERSLGAVSSGNAVAGHFAHGLLLQNTSASVITSLTVAYTGEQWRSANAPLQTVTFYYKIASTAITSLTPNNNTGWTAVSALNFDSLQNNIAAGALDGNLAANRTVIAAVAIPALTLASNDYIMIKWEDPDHLNTDHGMAIDDVTVSWTVLCPSSTIWNGITWSSGVPSATKTAIINGNYNTAINGNIDACSLSITAGTMTVAANTYVNIQNDLTVNTGTTLNIQNQGSLVMVNNLGIVTNTGTINVSRTTTPYEKFDYTYWSSPMVNTTIGSALGSWRNDYTFKFQTINFSDTTTAATGLPPADGFDDNNDVWVLTPQATVMSPGQGYIAMSPTTGSFPTTSTVTFTGTPNNGIITTPIVLSGNSGSVIDDFNLIGNPYASSIFADAFITTNTNISGTLYFWTHVKDIDLTAINPGPNIYNFRPDDYATYNLSGGTASTNGGAIPSGYVASGQGFLVEAITAGNITFNNTMRNSGYSNTNFYRNKNQVVKDRIWISIQNDLGMYSQQLLAYLQGTTLGYDRAYDGLRSKAMTYIHFYSQIENEEYKIQSRGDFDEKDTVPLGYQSEYSGEFKIKIDNTEGVLNSPSVNVYLEDKLLHITHNLKQSDYTFTTTIGKFENRFVLRYRDEILDNQSFSTFQNEVFVTTLNNEIKINSTSENIKNYTIYDVLGRILDSKNDQNLNQININTIARQHQALIIKTTLQRGQVITKKVMF